MIANIERDTPRSGCQPMGRGSDCERFGTEELVVTPYESSFVLSNADPKPPLLTINTINTIKRRSKAGRCASLGKGVGLPYGLPYASLGFTK